MRGEEERLAVPLRNAWSNGKLARKVSETGANCSTRENMMGIPCPDDASNEFACTRGQTSSLGIFCAVDVGRRQLIQTTKIEAGRTLLHRVAGWGQPITFISLLKDNEVDLDSTEELGCSALHFAASNGYSHVVAHLLKSWALASTEDISGRQAIWYAAQNGHSEVVKLLSSALGIDVRAADCQGRTPLHAAAAALAVEAPVAKNSARPPVSEEAQIECIRVLLTAGAAKKKDLQGNEPAQVAYSAAIKAVL